MSCLTGFGLLLLCLESSSDRNKFERQAAEMVAQYLRRIGSKILPEGDGFWALFETLNSTMPKSLWEKIFNKILYANFKMTPKLVDSVFSMLQTLDPTTILLPHYDFGKILLMWHTERVFQLSNTRLLFLSNVLKLMVTARCVNFSYVDLNVIIQKFLEISLDQLQNPEKATRGWGLASVIQVPLDALPKEVPTF